MVRKSLSRAGRLWRTGSLFLCVALVSVLFGLVMGALGVLAFLHLWRVLAG